MSYILTTRDYFLAVVTYVSFRSNRPDLATVMEVLKKLRDNNIDYSQLAITSRDQCQDSECKDKEEAAERKRDVGKGKKSSAILNILHK